MDGGPATGPLATIPNPAGQFGWWGLVGGRVLRGLMRLDTRVSGVGIPLVQQDLASRSKYLKIA